MNDRFERWLRHHNLFDRWQRAKAIGDITVLAAMKRCFAWHSPGA